MIIRQIYTYNNYRNFNYIIACSKTREAVAIDPLAYQLCLNQAKKDALKIVAVINTHEHFDHTGGNNQLGGLKFGNISSEYQGSLNVKVV